MTLSDWTEQQARAALSGAGVPLRIGPFVARVGTRVRELQDALLRLYRRYPVDGPGGIVDWHVRIEAPNPWRRFVGPQVAAYVDGRRRFAPFPRDQAFAMFEWLLNWCTFSRPHQYLILHSAVVERDGRALVLCGRPGAGKSTLCAALALSGWRLFSDEVALIRPGTREIHAAPRPISLKEGSIDVLRQLAPDHPMGPKMAGTRKGTVAHLEAPADAIARAEEPAEARWIVFPRWKAGASTTLTPLGRARAFLEAADNAFNYSLLGEVGFTSLAEVVDASDAYVLEYSDLDDVLGRFDRLASQEAVAS